MNKNLEAKLLKRFKFLSTPPSKWNIANFGIQCGDGWFNLIWYLCEELETLKQKTEVYKIQEKYGGLRFYISSPSKLQKKIILKKERESYSICEICGKKGKVYNGGGKLKTLCRECKKDVEINKRKNTREYIRGE